MEQPPDPLAELYARVPAALEEDLLEEVRAAEREQEVRDLAPTWVDAEEVDDLPDPGPVGEDDEEWRISPAQALGLVEHELGARPVDED